HVARKTGDKHALRLGEHHELSQPLRAQRHEHADAKTRPPAGGARRRFVYDAAGLLDPLPGALARKEGAAAAKDKAVNQAYKNLGITLDFFHEVFGRDSLDSRGMDVLAS